MWKSFLVLVLMVTAQVVMADEDGKAVCLGFRPETTLICEDGKVVYKIHAFEEVRCGAGRDGVLNDIDPIQNVDGPNWTDGDELAFVTFIDPSGVERTLHGCREL